MTVSRPSKRIVPASGAITPPIIIIRVDLPAPFSPMSATISPRWTSRSTSSSAVMPGKRLPMPSRLITGDKPGDDELTAGVSPGSRGVDIYRSPATTKLVYASLELINVLSLDYEGGNEDLFVCRNDGSIAAKNSSH